MGALGAQSPLHPFSDAVDLAAAIRARDVSPVEIVKTTLELIQSAWLGSQRVHDCS
jgi:hypothetical protein